jgi:hypothetical protein
VPPRPELYEWKLTKGKLSRSVAHFSRNTLYMPQHLHSLLSHWIGLWLSLGNLLPTFRTHRNVFNSKSYRTSRRHIPTRTESSVCI